MKTCVHCEKDKDESEFHRKTKDKLHSMCKECKKEYDKKWYKNNIRRRWLLNKRANERRIRNQKFIRNYKLSKGCEKCGYNKTYYALEFHHTDKNKEHVVSQMRTHSIETILKEIKKCIVLCANCHREIHYKENSN